MHKEILLQFIGQSLQLEQRNQAMNIIIAEIVDKMRIEMGRMRMPFSGEPDEIASSFGHADLISAARSRIGKPICKTYETALKKSLKHNVFSKENRRFTCVECRFFVSLYLEIERKNVI